MSVAIPGTGTAMAARKGATKPVHHIRAVGEDEFDNIVTDAAQYGRVQFWDAYFAEESEPFEWYYGYDYFRDCITENIPFDKRVMVAGVGSSNMPEDMAADGYKDIVAQDISRVAIAQLQIRCKHISEISYATCNMTDSDLPAESFFAIIDKAVLDSLLCSAMGNSVVQQYINEVERLLDPESGVFIFISHSNPEEMLPLLEQYDIDEPHYTPWYIEVQAVLKPQMIEMEELDADNPDHMYWIYVAIKNPALVKRKKDRLERNKKKTKKEVKKATIKAPNL